MIYLSFEIKFAASKLEITVLIASTFLGECFYDVGLLVGHSRCIVSLWQATSGSMSGISTSVHANMLTDSFRQVTIWPLGSLGTSILILMALPKMSHIKVMVNSPTGVGLFIDFPKAVGLLSTSNSSSGIF